MALAGVGQAEYMTRIGGLDRGRCLVVPIDVGKRSAMALVADHAHEVAAAPFVFDLTESGVGELLTVVDAVADSRQAVSVRSGAARRFEVSSAICRIVIVVFAVSGTTGNRPGMSRDV